MVHQIAVLSIHDMKVVAHEATAALSHGLKAAVVLVIDALYTVGQRNLPQMHNPDK